MSDTQAAPIDPAVLDAAHPANAVRPRFAKLREWTKLIAITGSAQATVQAIGFICGILVIRWLSVEQYALYTIANTMLATMTMLADGGIASGVMSQGGKVWQDEAKLGTVIATGIHLRRKFGLIAFLVAIPVLNYLLLKNGASIWQAIAISACLIPTFVSALTGTLLQIGPKLNQDIQSLQKIEVTSNIWRLAMNAVVLFILPFASLAILMTGLSQVYANWKLRTLSARHASPLEQPDPEVSTKIQELVRRILPTTIYFCLSSQITIWIVSILGNPSSIAQVGALGRISVLLSVLVSILATLMVPRFARMEQNPRQVAAKFYQIVVGLFGVLILFNIFAWAFPDALLGLLGDKYAGLQMLLRWSLAAATFGTLNRVTSQLMNSRGLVMPPTLYIPLAIMAQIAALASQDLTQLQGVFAAAILSSGFIFVLRNVYFLFANRDTKVAAS
ncbi:lipopolysaccharide biosynthesis protein [Rhodopirellula sallentina]|uniref:Polysaccharide biosynthesis protein n=1 Tax=Rhodopirellula sallentina SM41 TaxID=1263870 RepID=M5UJS5_9BACT|nr:polysaccharide biosynthesis protein [Rhodopirellula sallentina]EMI58106.1 polysaccharide biosynthesis protein [Rhodopirellula sallentina SM41]